MALLGGDLEDELQKHCRRDALLNYIVFQADIPNALVFVQRIASSPPEAQDGTRELYRKLREHYWADNNIALVETGERRTNMPDPLRKLLGSERTTANEQLLGSMIFSRVRQLGKLDVLTSQLLMQNHNIEVSPTRPAPPPSLHIKESTSSLVSRFDPLCVNHNSPSRLPKSQLPNNDLIWFSPSKCNPNEKENSNNMLMSTFQRYAPATEDMMKF